MFDQIPDYYILCWNFQTEIYLLNCFVVPYLCSCEHIYVLGVIRALCVFTDVGTHVTQYD